MLSRFAGYLAGSWSFQELLGGLGDGRSYSRIPASSVFLSVFGMFSLRLPSFNEMSIQLRLPNRWEPWTGDRKPSADTLGYALDRFDLAGLRRMNGAVAALFKRKKALERLYPDSHWVAAVDGVETTKSRKRCCAECCRRNVGTDAEPVIEYYHRYVVLQLVGVAPALMLDAEPVRQGETECAAALRLLERFKSGYPRFIDALTLDAFYLQAPFVRRAVGMGYHVVVVLKQANRELYQDAEGLFNGVVPQTIAGVDKTIQIWDVEGLTTWGQAGRPVRVVRQLERQTVRERIAGKLVSREVERDWRWAVISPERKGRPVAELVGKWGHARWDEETRGFGELTQHWHLNHCYRHHPTAMLACLLILFLAFSLTTVFFTRNLKPQAREGRTRLALARLLADDLALGRTAPFWPRPP